MTAALALSFLVGKARSESRVGGIVATLAFTAIPAGLWLFASSHLPHESTSWRDLVPGALLVGVGVQALNLFTIYWLPLQIDRKSTTYGTIATALAMLTWAFVLGRILTGSALLNASLLVPTATGRARSTRRDEGDCGLARRAAERSAGRGLTRRPGRLPLLS